MTVEAVLLSGGLSKRMGADKAALLVSGGPMGVRIARRLSEAGYEVTVLGSLSGASFREVADRFPGSGPLAALSSFQPQAEFVFVSSCDIPLFDAAVVKLLLNAIGDADAAIPVVQGRLQYLCGLYRSSSFRVLPELVASGERRLGAWVNGLRTRLLSEDEISSQGLDPRCVMGANTPEELAALLEEH